MVSPRESNTRRDQNIVKQNICAWAKSIPSSTVTSRASSASNGAIMYLSESNGRNFSETIAVRGRSFVELEASLFNGAGGRVLQSFPGSAALRNS